MKLKINQKMGLMMVVFFLIPLFMFSATFYTTQGQKNDSLIINLAGRQRMLSQKMSKESLTFLHQTMMKDQAALETKKSLLNTITVFELTLNGLIDSGQVPLSLNLEGEKKIVPATTGEAARQLQKVKDLWFPFKKAILRTLETTEEENILTVLRDNLPLLSAMDKATLLMQRQAESKVSNLFLGQAISMVVAVIIVFVVIVWSRRNIVSPIRESVSFAKTLSEGNLRKTIEVRHTDEIGTLGNALNHTVKMLSEMISKINDDVITLTESSGDMNSVADEMAGFSDTTVAKANTVAAAAEETDSAMNSIAAAMEQASSNVESVASSTEELSASIGEITQRTVEASTSVKNAVDHAQQATSQVSELGQAAEEIGIVSETIAAISDKTSLLALNATIEAARAGDAGKGFAVVAGEIKELAKQTVQATSDISAKLSGVQQLTDGTVAMIGEITQVIESVSLIIFGINESVEQQSMATREITQNIVQTSQGLREVAQNVSQTKQATGQVAQEISEVNENAEQLSNSSAQVQRTATRLNDLSEHLKELVGNFAISEA
jgi:methyl-accepting chemotaxis protein